MKTVLISGCSGFIGSHLTEFYLKKKYKVIGIDNFLTSSYHNIKHLENYDNFNFIEHDICKHLNFDIKPNYILHFASPASPFDYLKMPIRTLEIGSVGTQNILELAKKNKSVTLVASTSEVYGDPLEHPQKEGYFGNVNPVGPRGVYDEAKRYLEALTTAYHNKYSLDVKIARIFNTYGPRMRYNDGRAIPTFINQSLKNENFSVFGDGMQTRSFCYIDDLICGIDLLLKSKLNCPVNLGNPAEHTINDLIKIIKEINPNDSKINFYDLPTNDPKRRKPDISLANKKLNWLPKITLKEGLINTFKHYK